MLVANLVKIWSIGPGEPVIWEIPIDMRNVGYDADLGRMSQWRITLIVADESWQRPILQGVWHVCKWEFLWLHSQKCLVVDFLNHNIYWYLRALGVTEDSMRFHRKRNSDRPPS